MKIYFKLIDFRFALSVDFGLRTEFSLLREQIFEENYNGRLHLLEYVFANDLFCDFIASITDGRTACNPFQQVNSTQNFFDLV